eukprot:2854977-Rhodomonas_salina.2
MLLNSGICRDWYTSGRIPGVLKDYWYPGTRVPWYTGYPGNPGRFVYPGTCELQTLLGIPRVTRLEPNDTRKQF